MSMVHGGNDELHALLTIVILMMMIALVLITMSVRMVLIRFSTMSLELHQQLLSLPQVSPPTRTTTQSTGFMRSYLSSLVPHPTCCWTFSSQMGTLSILIRSDLYVIKILMNKYETKWRKIFCPGEWKRKPALFWICC